MFYGDKSLNENIIENFLTIDGFFNNEYTAILLEEFIKPVTYQRVLSAIASGCTKANEISRKAQMSSSLTSKYLSDLVMLDIVKKDTPVDDGNGKKVRYSIADPYLNFHYRYLAQLSDDMSEEEREITSCNLMKAYRTKSASHSKRYAPSTSKECGEEDLENGGVPTVIPKLLKKSTS